GAERRCGCAHGERGRRAQRWRFGHGARAAPGPYSAQARRQTGCALRAGLGADVRDVHQRASARARGLQSEAGAAVISPDRVRARRRGERLELMPLRGPARAEAERLASDIAETLALARGQSEEEAEQRLSETPRAPSAEKLFSGLTKVLLDECEFEAPLDVDAAELRRAVFEHAARIRREDHEGTFARDQVLAAAARELGLEAAAVEQALFSDLRGARLLTKPPLLEPAEVLQRYETAQVQGVLLRAVRIGLDVVCSSPDAYRALFRKLKFRR